MYEISHVKIAWTLKWNWEIIPLAILSYFNYMFMVIVNAYM